MIGELIEVAEEQLLSLGPGCGATRRRLEGEIACLRLLDELLNSGPQRVLEALKLALVLIRAPAPGQVVVAARAWEQWRRLQGAKLGHLSDAEAGLAGAVRSLPKEGDL